MIRKSSHTLIGIVCLAICLLIAGMKLEPLARDFGPAPEDSQDGCPG